MMHLSLLHKLLLLAFLLPCLANAEHFHVSKAGSDDNDGKSMATAFRTIQKGVDRLDAGDTLIIGPGEYAEAVFRSGLGNSKAETTLRAAIPGTVLLRGDTPVERLQKVEGRRFVYSVKWPGEPYAVEETDTLVILNRAEYLTELEFLPGSYFYDADASRLYLSSSDLRSPAEHHYRASITPRHGLHLAKATRVTLEGLAATGYHFNDVLPVMSKGGTKWGFVLEDATQSTIRNCTAYLNGGGICILGKNGGGSNTVENCTAYANFSRFTHEGGNIVIYDGGPDDLLAGNYVYRSAANGQRIYITERGHMKMQGGLGWGNTGGDFWMKGIRPAAGPVTAERIISLTRALGHQYNHSLLNLAGHGQVRTGDSIYLSGERELQDAEFADPEHFDFRLQKGSRFSKDAPGGRERGPFPYRNEVYFVSPEGNDASDGRSVAEAWKTLAHALKSIKKGDTLYLLAGEYPEAVSLEGVTGLSLRRRGKGAVFLRGEWKVNGASDLSFHRLTFTGKVTFTRGNALLLENCAFVEGGTLQLEKVERPRISHGLFEQTVTFSKASRVHLTGNLYAGIPGIAVSDEKSLLYSDYNSYRSEKQAWKVGSSLLSLEALGNSHDLHSIVAVPELEITRRGVALRNASAFAAAGPLGTAIGLWFEGDLPPLGAAGPFVHSTSDTTANIEWWTSLPAETELAWGTTPACEHRKTFRHHNYAAYSLTGLLPGQTYYYRLTVKKTAPGVAVAPWMPPTEIRPVEGTFTTDAEPRSAREWYVAPDGDDTRDGASRATALRTLNHAAERVGPGDTVWIAGGDYRETVWLRASGEKGRPITFRAAPGERVTFDGVSRRLFAAFVGNGKHHQLFDSLHSVNLGYKGGHDGATLAVELGGMFALSYCDDVEIHRCLMDGRGRGYSPGLLSADRCDRLLVKNCVITGGYGSLHFTDCRNLRVENNVFFRNMMTQMQVFGSFASTYLANNIFTDGLPVKAGNAMVLAGRGIFSENNCFYPREPRDKKAIFKDAQNERWMFEDELSETDSILANPEFAVLAGIRGGENGSVYPVDHLPQGPLRLEDFLARNPEVVRRGIGLQIKALQNH